MRLLGSDITDPVLRRFGVSIDLGLLLSLMIIPLAIGHFWMLLIALRGRQWIWSAAILILPVSQFFYGALPVNRAKASKPIILLLIAAVVSGAIIALSVAMSIPINATDFRMFSRAAIMTLLISVAF